MIQAVKYFALLYFVASFYPLTIGIVFVADKDIIAQVGGNGLTPVNNSSGCAFECPTGVLYFAIANIVVFFLKIYLALYFFFRTNIQELIKAYTESRPGLLRSRKYNVCFEWFMLLPFHIERIPYFSVAVNVFVRTLTLLNIITLLALYLLTQANVLLMTDCQLSGLLNGLMATTACFEFIMASFFAIFASAVSIIEDNSESKEPTARTQT